jgi:D-alanyl-D-alanine carboxypeptidase
MMNRAFQKYISLLVGAVALVPALSANADARHISTAHVLRHSNLCGGRQSSRGKGQHSKRRHHVAAQPVQQQQIGALVLTENGDVVYDRLSDNEFNPASVAKIVTAFAAIKTLGLNHQFTTSVSEVGELNPSTGVLKGDLYVKGCDPDFDINDASALRESLIAAGLKQIEGKLIVSPDFSYGSASDASWSANRLMHALSIKHGIKVRHGCAVEKTSTVATATPMFELQSEPLRRTLKEMLSYSQNNVAEQIGRCIGGISKVQAIVSEESGLLPGKLHLASASGLGKNRVKPKDMMQVLRAFRAELQRSRLDLQDLLPVAGIDGGTLDERFVEGPERGSVVGKTGTLPGTDGGASALAGMCRSQKENLYFVIFCWRGNVVNFRHQQDEFIRKLQADRGGPKPFDYYLPLEVSRASSNPSHTWDKQLHASL